MRRVWTSRGVLLPLLVALAVSFVFLGRGGHIAEASPFKPTLTTTLASSAAGVASDINQNANFGTSVLENNRSFPASSVYFTPGNWGIPNCAGFGLSSPGNCPIGLNEKTGNFTTVTTFGILNSQCALAFTGVVFANGMRNSSTDPSDTISPGAGFASLNADVNPADGIPDGAEHWNTLLSGLQSAGLLPATPPRERQILSTVALGTQVWVDVLTYDPGLLGGAASTPLGYATTFILENANPLNPPAPGLITDTCGLQNGISQFGLASPSGTVHRSNPTSPGSSVFSLQAGSQRDADQGPSAPVEPTKYTVNIPPFGNLSGAGFVNSLDTCPFQPNDGSPLAPAGAPFNGDANESPGDGIDTICDPNGYETGAQCANAIDDDGDGVVNDGCPAVGTPETGAQCANAIDDDGDGFVNDGCPVSDIFSGSDMDGDAYLNRGDNCPQAANGAGFGAGTDNQADTSEVAGPPAANEVGQQPVDGGPASDSIGDDCDLGLHASVPDGHFHSALKLAPVCVGTTDSDGDGWCDATEAFLGSNPGSATSTPESLQVPGSCSDGADNDGDGSADLNDSGCQLPMLDLSIKKLNSEATLPCAGGTVAYTLLINDPGLVDTTGEISIYLDSQPSYVPGPGAAQRSAPDSKSAGSVVAGSVVASFGGTVTGSGPINDDGDADVEWLTKAAIAVKHSPATTAINFNVTYPPVSPCSGPGTTDFVLTVDLCHGNDVAPLGVGPLNGNCAGSATSDGSQDRNSSNDIISKNIDAQ